MFKIIEKLGGDDAFFDLVAQNAARKGFSRPTKHTVKKWKTDGRLPDHVAMIAAEECVRRGLIFDPADCRDHSRNGRAA